MSEWVEDLLGSEYESRKIDLGIDPDGEGQIDATLVRRVPTGPVQQAVIYVHGFTDYFFQTELAEFFADRGYAFSLRGVAREYSHATGATFRDPAERDFAELQPGSGHTTFVEDVAPVRGNIGASEFVTRVVRGVDPSRPTPYDVDAT